MLDYQSVADKQTWTKNNKKHPKLHNFPRIPPQAAIFASREFPPGDLATTEVLIDGWVGSWIKIASGIPWDFPEFVPWTWRNVIFVKGPGLKRKIVWTNQPSIFRGKKLLLVFRGGVMKCSWDRKILPGYPEGFAHKEKQWPTRVPAGIPVFFPTRSVDFVVCS